HGGDHSLRPAVGRPGAGACGTRARHVKTSNTPARGRAAGGPDRHPADGQRVHHATQAHEPCVRDLGDRAPHRIAGVLLDELQLRGGLHCGCALLPRDRLDPDVHPEQARAPIHVHVCATAPCCNCSGRSCNLARRAMSYLRATDVTKWYGDVEVLRGVTFEIEPGQVKAIIGPSGSGKSTLLRCLAVLEEPNSGTVMLGDARPGPGDVGMVFQRFNLFQNMTALQNVMCGLVEVRRQSKADARKAALEFLARVGLADKGDQYPDELSGGQAQRVAIARALVMRPKAMLFDEPTSALDIELVREVLDVMESLAQEGMTMVVVSHELRFAHHVASSVLMMDEGRIVEEAPPDEFFSAPKQDRTRRFLALVE